MDDVILVLNSGSSSIKFSVFVERADQIELKFRGSLVLPILNSRGDFNMAGINYTSGIREQLASKNRS